MINFFKKYQWELFASFALSVTVFMLFPISVYQKNTGAVAFNLGDIWLYLLMPTLISFIVSALIGIAIRKYFSQYIGVIYFAVIICFWVQGSLLNYNLGKLDGHNIIWSDFQVYYFAEAVLWLGCIAAAVWFRKFLYRNLNVLLIIFLLSETVPLIINDFTIRSTKTSASKLYFNYDQEFEFSAERNVVVIVLDTVQSNAAEQVLEDNPPLQSIFKDFTYFQNTSGGYVTTEPSIPLMLSGQYYDNSMPFDKYLTKTKRNSLPIILKENGYKVEYYALVPFAYPNAWDNASNIPASSDIVISARKLYLVTFLRYLPLPLKPFIVDLYYKGNNFWGKDMVELYNNSSKTKKVEKDPVFKFIHLTGSHPPFVLDTSFHFIEHSDYLTQTEASLVSAGKLIREMKDAGVYDNSLIIVLGDHGYPYINGIKDDKFQGLTDIVRSGTPLLMAKKFNQRRPSLSFSNSPVSISDIPKTITESLKIKSVLSGISIFNDMSKDRSRFFYFYSWREADWNAESFPELYKIEINGNVRDVASWKFLGERYLSSGQVDIVQNSFYNYGDDLISKTNPFIRLSSIGFGVEDKFAWATGPLSCVYLPVNKTDSTLTLNFSVMPFLNKEHLPRQQMDILADDHLVETLQLDKDYSFSSATSIPPNITYDGNIKLCFAFPDAKYSPMDLGLSNNSRYLGGLFNSIVINELPSFSYHYGDNMLSKSYPLMRQLSSGFNMGSEAAWASSPQSCIYNIPLLETDKSLVLSFTVTPFLDQEYLPKQEMNILVNDQEVESLQLNATNSGSKTISLPSRLIGSKDVKLCFAFPDAQYSPQDLGVSDDPRHLGGYFNTISINEVEAFSLPVEFNFGDKGNTGPIKNGGWAGVESDHTWTDGRNAELLIPFKDSPTGDLQLVVSATPFITGEELTRQLVIVRANGHEVGRWKMMGAGEYSLTIPAVDVANDWLKLEFEMPDATSPVSLKVSEDSRILGMAVYWLKIQER